MAMNDTVRSILECAICIEELQDPKTLPCNHSFCKRCLADFLKSKYAKKDGSLQKPTMTTSILCPKCKTSSKEFRSLDDIGTLHIINQLLEAQAKERGERQKVSIPCACGKIAKMCCYRCKECCCLDCCRKKVGSSCSIQNAGLSGFMQGSAVTHVFVTINTPFQEDDCDCVEHSLPLDLFCSDCSLAVCMNCFLRDHNLHQCKLVKYARQDALAVVEMIKAIRVDIAEKSAHLHQVANNVSKCALENEQRIHTKLEECERRIHGLITSLFEKAKSFYSYKSGIRRSTAEEAMGSCDSPKSKHATYNFNDCTDFDLACLMKDLLTVKNKAHEEATNIGEKIKAMRQPKFQTDMDLFINEEHIFTSLLGIFEDFKLGSKYPVVFVPRNFTFVDYLEGKYADDSTHQNASKAHDGALAVSREPIRAYLPERICYDRDFLLSLRDCGVRPILAEEFSSIVNQSISNEARPYEPSLVERRPIQGRSRGMRRVQSELNVTGFGNAYAGVVIKQEAKKVPFGFRQRRHTAVLFASMNGPHSQSMPTIELPD